MKYGIEFDVVIEEETIKKLSMELCFVCFCLSIKIVTNMWWNSWSGRRQLVKCSLVVCIAHRNSKYLLPAFKGYNGWTVSDKIIQKTPSTADSTSQSAVLYV